jgi:hypothetical protein
VLAETVKVCARRKSRLDTQILRLKNDRMVLGREQDLVRLCPYNGEGEGRSRVRELDAGLGRRHTLGGRAREHRFGHLITIMCGVGDFDMDARFLEGRV